MLSVKMYVHEHIPQTQSQSPKMHLKYINKALIPPFLNFSLSPVKEINIQMWGRGVYSPCISKGLGGHEGTSWVVDTTTSAAHKRNEPDERCSAGSDVSPGFVCATD